MIGKNRQVIALDKWMRYSNRSSFLECKPMFPDDYQEPSMEIVKVDWTAYKGFTEDELVDGSRIQSPKARIIRRRAANTAD